MANETAKLIIAGENRTDAAFRQVRASMGDLDKVSARLTRTLAGLGLGVSFGLLARQTAAAVLEAEKSEARLAATLKATGYTAGFTAQELELMNEQLVRTSEFDDEGIRNAQAQMVKFGNISGDVFRRALTLSADYAELLGTDLPNGAQQLGRALTAPNIGLTFLERNVGKFSDATHRSITEMLSLGNTAGAQRLILDELDKRIGGVAKTMDTKFTKATTDSTKAWNDMLEAFGRTPSVQKTAETSLSVLAKSMEAIRHELEDTSTSWKNFFHPIGTIAETAARGLYGEPGKTSGFQADVRAIDDAIARAKAVQDAERQNFLTVQSAAQADEASKAWAKSVGTLASFSQAQEDAYNSAGDLQKQLDKQVKSIDDETLAMAKQAAYMAQLSQEREDQYNSASALQAQLDKLKDKTDDGAKAARELGLTFASAFEDAIVQAKSLQDVIRGLAQDILRILIRKSVTEPLAGALSSVFSGWFGGAKAGGGDVYPGKAYIVGDAGPELLVPRGAGTIVPNDRLAAAAGGLTIHQPIYFSANTPAAVRDAVYAMLPTLTQATQAAIIDAKGRGAMPGFA